MQQVRCTLKLVWSALRRAHRLCQGRRVWRVLATLWIWPALSTGAHAQDIVVGQLASLSNPLTRQVASEYHGGVELAFRRANDKGGIQGRKLRLLLLDDGFDPERTTDLAQQLVDRHEAVALVGVMGTQTSMRLVRDGFMKRNRIANVAPLTGLAEILGAEHVFPVRASFDDEVKAMLVHAAGLGHKRVALLYFRAGAGPALSRLAPEWARAAGLVLVANEGFASDPDSSRQRIEIERAVDQLSRVAPHAVILIAVGPVYAGAVKILRDRFSPSLSIYSLGQVNVEDLVRQVGANTARGIMLSQVMPAPSTVDRRIAREFVVDRHRWNPGLPATYLALEGYVAGRVVAGIAQRARVLSREGMLAAAYDAGNLDVADFRVQYGYDLRRSMHPVDMTMIDRHGRLLR